MSEARNTFARRLTAGLGIVAVATAALLGSVLPAQATEATPGPGNINPATSKSLTIHKFAQPEALGTAPDGKPLPAEATNRLTPLQGVTFQVQKVTNIDLSTNAGWAATKTMTPELVSSANLGPAVAGVTTADGTYTFQNLAQAVYLVTETHPGNHNIAFAAKPFLVTLPLPSANDSTWIYNVHVYPKNSLTSAEKSVDDSQATGLGSEVIWNIAAKVPFRSEGNSISSFAVSDTLDPRLSYRSATLTLAPASSPLIQGADYGVDTTTTPGTVTFNFTSAGLVKLLPGAQVKVALKTAVVSLDLATGPLQGLPAAAASGIIKNKAVSFINGKQFTSNEVQSSWGNVVINKVASNDAAKSLQGAEFQVYASEADAKAGLNAIAVSGQTVFTTGVDGIVRIAGLRATVNGTATAVGYWLVETKAPTGYGFGSSATRAVPKAFTVSPGKVTKVIDITVANPQVPPFMLPLTGGSGTAAFMTIGLGLLAIAGGVAVNKQRTRRVAQS